MEIDKQECSKCKGLFPDTLIPTDGICVYCKADAAEQVVVPKEPVPPKVRKQQQIPTTINFLAKNNKQKPSKN